MRITIMLKGALAAARQGDQINPEKESSGSQFYIVQGKVWEEEDLLLDRQKLQEGIYKLIESDSKKYATLAKELRTLYTSGKYDEYEQRIKELIPAVEGELDLDVSREIPEERVRQYTTVGGVPHLDGEYTVFGVVVEGLEVVDKIAAVETDKRDKPLEDMAVTIELQEINKSELAERYGIQYRAPETDAGT